MKKNKDQSNAGVKEIARRAKVSIATVDRVIHNRPGVSEQTKARINEIIQELNYQPNVLAQRLALASRGIRRLAVLLPAISGETEFWQAPLEGVNKAAGEIRQYNVHIERFFFDQNNQQSFAGQVQQIRQYKPDGVLFSPTFLVESGALIEECKSRGIPYVLINSDIPGTEHLCYIGPELFHSGQLAAQLLHYCIKEGEQVLLANIAREIDSNHAILRKEEGFRAYWNAQAPEVELVPFNSTDTDYAAVADKLSQLLKEQHKIGAIFVTNSRVSLVARWMEQEGINDILLIGYDFLNDNVQYLKKGGIDFLICEKPQEQGYRGVMTLFQNLVYGATLEKDYYMPIDIITKENCQFYRN
ncbi:MAG: LacI family DNA-binding transcriptional regulator [Candidatus Pseudobacter hemicellulosilyticus]|uniref:LacI family DNA-binding transcriptional regulator n=1 Tax=Candidatus Pseudobacter hemicellulosilyticus TaxID=3121375 RepID=A0AAJ5WR15_9BACT|nr:MAG: LacI family DNA-binding transcriptional regulator [Pseudobacter sp.]